MNTKKYIGITIGPIYKTLSMARKTREMWGASYIFSYLMRTIIEHLVDEKKGNIEPDCIIIPSSHFIKEKKYHHGAGLYPDRLIFRSQNGDFEKVKKIVSEVLSNLGQSIGTHIKKDIEQVKNYIANYFQVYFLEKEIEGGKNPVIELSPYLDTLELQQKFIPEDDSRCLAEFLDKVNHSFMFNDAFKHPDTAEMHMERFKSIIEISAAELKKIDENRFNKIINEYNDREKKGIDDDEGFIITELKKIPGIKEKKLFKTCHKYIAIVQADGDRIGDALKQIGNDEDKLKNFSEKLTQFAHNAAGKIAKYGGTPVYVGGDDLLFFAPVINGESLLFEEENRKISTVFSLIDALDSKFKKIFKDASLSFGLSISYYKFPLNEALEQARDLLLKQAKHCTDEKGNEIKNALAFRVLKHSGAAFGATFNKDSEIYKGFRKLLATFLSGDEKYLNSVIHTLQLHRGIFKHIGQDKKRVENFLENSFDEEIHEDYKPFLENTANLIFTVYSESQPGENEERKFARIYAILRTMHFLKRKDNE